MKPGKFNKVIENTEEGVRENIKLSIAILDRINYLLNIKFQGKQKLLAERMNKSEAEVSKWLSGVQNFTIKTISRLEAAFGESILAVVTTSHEHSTFELVKTPHIKTEKQFFVKTDGRLIEELAFKPVQTNDSSRSSKINLPS